MTTIRNTFLLAAIVLLMGPATSAPAHHAPGNSCQKGLAPLRYNGLIRTTRFDYHIIRSSLPASSRSAQERIIRSIRFGGMRPWNSGRTDCHYPRFNVFATAFISDRGSSYDDHGDGRSTVDFGPSFGCGEMSVACASHEFTGGNFRNRRVAKATDIRFRKADDIHWYTGSRVIPRCRTGVPQCYDLRSAAAHEVGHAVGLANHTGEQFEYQTMHTTIASGRGNYPTRQRTLGRLDYVGLTNIYTGMAPLEP